MKKISSILLCGLMLILSACEKDTESSNFAPVVTTGSASNIYRMGATLSGSIQLTETNTAKNYGILFSELESMAEYDEYPVKDASSNFSVQIQNLEPGTTYYYCAYASSGYSTAKSQIKSFTTTNSNAPVFNEVILQSKDEKSCTVSVEILDEGGSDLLISGFVWKEVGNGDPTIQDNVVNVEPQGSRLSATIKGMEPNKTYLVRAYAISSNDGIGYSNSISVTTNAAIVPFLSDITFIDSTAVSITVKSSVKDAGSSPVTKFGFCYSSEISEPTTAHLIAENVEGTSTDFSVTIEYLNPETTYYIRAYAENDKGIGYSETFEFTTGSTQIASLMIGAIVSVIEDGEVVETKSFIKSETSKPGYSIPSGTFEIDYSYTFADGYVGTIHEMIVYPEVLPGQILTLEPPFILSHNNVFPETTIVFSEDTVEELSEVHVLTTTNDSEYYYETSVEYEYQLGVELIDWGVTSEATAEEYEAIAQIVQDIDTHHTSIATYDVIIYAGTKVVVETTQNLLEKTIKAYRKIMDSTTRTEDVEIGWYTIREYTSHTIGSESYNLSDGKPGNGNGHGHGNGSDIDGTGGGIVWE